MARPQPIFYGWVIVGIAVISLTLVYGIRHSFAIFFPPILDEFGWSRGSTAFMFSLNVLIYGFVAPVAGSLGDRWKPRRVMLIGIAILGLTTASCAFANELWHFYLLFGILTPVGTALSGIPLFTPTLANWFVKRRGLAMGLGQAGSGFSFTYGILANFAISQLGWRPAFFVLAGILVIFVLPLYALLFHYRPEDKGLKAYGTSELLAAENSTVNVVATEPPVFRHWTLGQAMRTYQLWLLVLTNFLYWGIGIYLVLAHQVKFAKDMGYSSVFAATVFGLFGIFMVAGLLSAFISDWIGREKTMTLAVILAIVAVAALVSVNNTSQPWFLYVYATCFGYGAGLYVPTLFAGAADVFHGKRFGMIAGLVLTGMGMGGAIGPWLGGYIYDISGSYSSAFLICMVCFGLAGIAFWVAAPRNAAKLRARSLSMS